MRKISIITILATVAGTPALAADWTVDGINTIAQGIRNANAAAGTVPYAIDVTADDLLTIGISKSISITGIGTVSIGGLSFTGGMGMVSDINNVTLTGRINNGDGFAPQSGHTLTLTNVTMSGIGTGSAAIQNDGKLIINGGLYENNLGNSNGGGAIMNVSAETTYVSGGAQFIGNSASGGGGAIQQQSTGAMDIRDSFFTNNSTTMYGGAVRWGGNGIIENTIFEGNTANIGGALYATSASSVLTINGGEFNNNHTNVENNAATGYGGAINTVGTLNLNNVIFNTNRAESGGAIEASGKTTIIGGEFNGNIALGYGGGAIDFDGGSYGLFITGTTFTENQATAAEGGDGGAIYLGGALTMQDVTFTKNTATGTGGAISRYNGSLPVSINGATFTGNTAGMSGGAASLSNLTLKNATFTDNHSYGMVDPAENVAGGGALMLSGVNNTMDNVTFSDNTAAMYGGALFMWSTTNAMLTNVTFDNNTADMYGGAIFNYATPTTAITVGGNSKFTNNSADIGGAIFNLGTLNLDTTAGNIVFAGNTDNAGGADIFNNDDPNALPTINITGDANVISMDGGIGGLGYINKTGANMLVLENSNDSTAFIGEFRQSAGRTLVYSTTFFGGENYITNGSRLSILNTDTEIETLHLETGGIVGLRETYGNVYYDGEKMMTSTEYMPNKLVVDTITSDGTGIIMMESDGTTSDLLQITGSATGDFLLHIDAIGNNPTIGKIEVVDFTSANIDNATFALDARGNIFKIGAYEYDLVREDDAGHDNWYLEVNGNLNASAQTAASIPALHLSVVKSGMNELRKRMGALRNNNQNNDLVGAWIRGYGKNATIKDVAKTEMNLFGLEGGFDMMTNALNGKIYFGLMAGYLDSEDITITTSRGAKANGYTRTPSVGAYLTWMHKSGSSSKWFVDLTARHFWVHDNIERNDYANGYDVTRSFWAFSAEVGKLFYMESPEWMNIGDVEHSHVSIEPKAEVRYGRGASMDFEMDNGTEGYVETTNALSTRLYVQANFLPNGTESTWKPFIELGVYNEWAGETDMVFAGETIKASDTSGFGFEASLGANATISDSTYAYGAATLEAGKVYTSYQLSIGIRTKF